MDRIKRALRIGAIAATMTMLTTTGHVVAQDEREPGPLVGIGEDIWRGQSVEGGCWSCHGNMANGRNEDPRSPQGADLRESLMDVETLAQVIRCGLPGTPMPYFGGRNAYTEREDSCYGTTAEALGELLPPEGALSFNARQIDALAQFIHYQYVGRGPATFEECIAFYGENASSCNRWPTEAELAAGAGGG